MTTKIFFNMPGYQKPTLEKRIFDLSPLGKVSLNETSDVRYRCYRYLCFERGIDTLVSKEVSIPKIGIMMRSRKVSIPELAIEIRVDKY